MPKKKKTGKSSLSSNKQLAAVLAELKACQSKSVMFGSVFNSDEVAMETPEHVADRLCAAAEVLSPERIMAAPDCGLVMCSPDVAVQKLQVMCAGAHLARVRAGLA